MGSFAGAGIGALAVAAGLGLTPQLLVLGTIALLGAGLLTSRMLPRCDPHAGADEQPETDALSASRWSGGMILLGAIAFAGMLCEGASADWASVYLSGPLHATGAVPGLGYAASRSRWSPCGCGQPAAQALQALHTFSPVLAAAGFSVPFAL